MQNLLNRAAKYANRFPRGERLERAEKFLTRCGYDTFGVEYASCADREVGYLNAGDTYSATILQENGGDVFVSSWGDWYEAAEADYCEENNEIRCGYCGEFTELVDRENWRDTVCSYCGRYVDSGELPGKRNRR